jgi:hypothetical protein
MELDISWNGLRPNGTLRKFMEALGGNRTLQYLNLSWNNLMHPPLALAAAPALKETSQEQNFKAALTEGEAGGME